MASSNPVDMGDASANADPHSESILDTGALRQPHFSTELALHSPEDSRPTHLVQVKAAPHVHLSQMVDLETASIAHRTSASSAVPISTPEAIARKGNSVKARTDPDAPIPCLPRSRCNFMTRREHASELYINSVEFKDEEYVSECSESDAGMEEADIEEANMEVVMNEGDADEDNDDGNVSDASTMPTDEEREFVERAREAEQFVENYLRDYRERIGFTGDRPKSACEQRAEAFADKQRSQYIASTRETDMALFHRLHAETMSYHQRLVTPRVWLRLAARDRAATASIVHRKLLTMFMEYELHKSEKQTVAMMARIFALHEEVAIEQQMENIDEMTRPVTPPRRE